MIKEYILFILGVDQGPQQQRCRFSFCYRFWLWLEAFTNVPARTTPYTILHVVLSKKVLVWFIIFNVFDKLRYYATFKVRKIESFRKVNTCVQKTTTCIGLQTEQIFPLNIYIFFNFECGFCGSFCDISKSSSFLS